jgi:tetratricopeptide (TPR) repeat protein
MLAERFEDVIYQHEGRPKFPLKWTAAQRAAAVAAARLRLQFVVGDYAAAATVLEKALADSADAPEVWRTAARSLLVVALAGQANRRGDAAEVLQALAAGSAQQLLEILDGLAAIARAARPEAASEIAHLQLDAITTLAPAGLNLDSAGKARLQQIQADALATTGQREEALALYRKLAEEHPQQGDVQEGYAQLLLDAADKTTLEQALAQWRIVDRGSRPGTERWFRAKYSIALAYYKLGDKQRAAQLIQYLQATQPNWESSALKTEFEDLLRESQGSSAQSREPEQ